MKIRNGLIIKAFYFLISPLLLISYLLEPFTQDVRIYLGAAKVTALTPLFPQNLDLVWESRPVGHRFLYYILNLFDPFDGWLYSIWMKFIVMVFTLIILYYFSKKVSERIWVSFDYIFILGILGLFAINNFMIFSAEYFSVVVAMMMITLLLTDRKNFWVLSGLLVLPLFLLKGLTVLLVFIVMLAVMLLVADYKERFYAALSSIPVTLLSFFGISLLFPHFISDIFLLGKLVHLTRLDLYHTVEYFFTYGIGVIGFAPLILIGLFVLFEIGAIASKSDVRDLRLILAMWGVASIYPLFIGEFFYYHYYLMLIPAILTICYFFKIYERHDLAFSVIVISVLVIYAAVVAGWSVGLSFKGYDHWNTFDDRAADILDRYDLTNPSSLLYLDDGLASYYFPTVSACRYVGALPYQRYTPDWNMTDRPEYFEMRDCLVHYNGNYIIVDDTFMKMNLSTHSEMKDKISTQYNIVYSNYWDVYERKDRLFSNSTLPCFDCE